MKKSLFWILLISNGLFAQQKTISFNNYLEQYFNTKCLLDPIYATYNSINTYNDKFPNYVSQEYIDQNKLFTERFLLQLTQYDRKNLNKEEQLSYDILKWELERQQEKLNLPLNEMPLNQFFGVHLTMGQFAGGESVQPFKTKQDYINWLKRVDEYIIFLDSAQVHMKKGIKTRRVLPKSLIKKMIPQFQAGITAKPEENLFYSPIKNFPNNFSQLEKDSLSASYKKMITTKLIPAYQGMVSFLTNEYLPKGQNNSGINKIPRGKEIYDYYVKEWTTTDLTPEEIHKIGLQEVARIKSEMEKVKQEVGFKGTLPEFFNYVRDKEELKPFTEPNQVISNFNAIHQKMKPQLVNMFSLTPQTPFEVRRTEAFREQTASAEYVQGSPDGTRPGIFYVPIPNVKEYNYYGDEDLFLHEAIPGHHYQISIQQENLNLPKFRRFNWFGAYGEGWALYTESLGKELGLYTDPYQYFGMLSNEMHRAIRLVVDTGIHTKGWTREKAIKYSLENEAEPEASITAEIERYMAIPGQALSYKIGQLKIIELRNKAQKELGTNFNIKDFHAQVLESGVMPLNLLEQKINQWILNNKQ